MRGEGGAKFMVEVLQNSCKTGTTNHENDTAQPSEREDQNQQTANSEDETTTRTLIFDSYAVTNSRRPYNIATSDRL